MDAREVARLRLQADAATKSSGSSFLWLQDILSWLSSRLRDKLAPPCLVHTVVEWQPIFPPRQVPSSSSNSHPLQELKAFYGLGRVMVPEVAPACTPNSARTSMGASVVVAPGGAYKFVGMPGAPEGDSVLQWLCCTVGVTAFLLKYHVPTVGPKESPE